MRRKRDDSSRRASTTCPSTHPVRGTSAAKLMRACSATRVFSGMSSNGPTARAASTTAQNVATTTSGLPPRWRSRSHARIRGSGCGPRTRGHSVGRSSARRRSPGLRDEVAQEQVAVAAGTRTSSSGTGGDRPGPSITFLPPPPTSREEGEEELVQEPLREQRADDALAPLRTARRARRGGRAGRAMRRRSPARRRRGRPPSRRARSRSRGAAPRTGVVDLAAEPARRAADGSTPVGARGHVQRDPGPVAGRLAFGQRLRPLGLQQRVQLARSHPRRL